MAWSEEIVKSVWEKGNKVASIDDTKWRKDDCGAWISRTAHGNRSSDYGWEIDHISPGGSDELENLRPLQWQNNVDKGDGRLQCNITASGKKNINTS